MTRQRTAAILGAVVVIAGVVMVTGGAGAAPSAAGGAPHGAENGNYTVNLPFATDHYPRSKNPGGSNNASINHFAAGTQEVFTEAGAPDGVEYLEYLIIENKDIDFSQCSTSNTAAFGIDRDNDDPGTKVDVDLLRYMEKNQFNDNSIEVYFYEGDELASPSPPDKGGKETGKEDGDGNAEFYPDDEIVAHQGYKSGGGPCYAMPKEPGWYQIDGYVNGTSYSDNYVEISVLSHYFWICECQNEQEARQQLGPPPSDSNPTPVDEQTATPTPTPVDEQTATPTPTPADDPQQTEQQQTEQQKDQQTEKQRTQQGSGRVTPTAGSGPGFGLVAALGGVLAAALLAFRRD